MLGLIRYQWVVLAAAWLGWGFDVFDALLFNFVAPTCIPYLLGLEPGAPAAREATVFWIGALSALLLVGWAIGGTLFGWFADRYGRRLALMVTILVYAFGTTACAFATSIEQLALFRVLTSLGIGGEWAVGASLVAETVPENRRIEAAILLQTASPIGIIAASGVSYLFMGVWFLDSPETAWRYVFLCGLAPVAVALLVRFFVRESETWLASAAVHGAPRIRELWSHEVRRATVAAIVVSITCLITWWAINAFIPVLGSLLAAEHARMLGLADEEARALSEAWKSRASNAFNLGGLLGGFAAIPLAKWLGRRTMFVTYYIAGGVAILAAFGLDLSAEIRLQLLFVVGAAVYGVFSAHVFYLPELFPTRLRALGSGFTYNIGRVVAALGPSVVGIVAARAGGSPDILMQALLWVAVIPFVAAATARILIVETRGRELPR